MRRLTYGLISNYDIKRLRALFAGREAGASVFYVNPAFWAGLEVKH